MVVSGGLGEIRKGDRNRREEAVRECVTESFIKKTVMRKRSGVLMIWKCRKRETRQSALR